jgi:hypothetical protein
MPHQALRAVPRLALEHLPPVPFEVAGLRPPVGVLRRADLLAVERHQRLVEPGRAVGLVGDEHRPLRDRVRTQVEGLVVEHAEGEPVALGLRAAGLVPADVVGVQSDGYRAEPHIEAADRSPKYVGLVHPLPEGRVAFPAGHSRLQRQADRVRDVVVQRLREMPLEDPRGDGCYESTGFPFFRIGGTGRSFHFAYSKAIGLTRDNE